MQTGRQRNVSVPDEAMVLQRARIITGALMGGVVTFACVASFLILSGTMTSALPESARTYLPVGFIAAFAVIMTAPMVGNAAARGASGEQAFMVGTLVKQALREGVGLAGIVLSLLAARAEWVLAFAALSVLAMGAGWPRAEDLREASRQRPR